MQDFEQAIETYEAGLKIEPNNDGLKKAKDDAERELQQQGGNKNNNNDNKNEGINDE